METWIPRTGTDTMRLTRPVGTDDLLDELRRGLMLVHSKPTDLSTPRVHREAMQIHHRVQALARDADLTDPQRVRIDTGLRELSDGVERLTQPGAKAIHRSRYHA
jgi:hypothetical protein